jgi:hypothetical protein
MALWNAILHLAFEDNPGLVDQLPIALLHPIAPDPQNPVSVLRNLHAKPIASVVHKPALEDRPVVIDKRPWSMHLLRLIDIPSIDPLHLLTRRLNVQDLGKQLNTALNLQRLCFEKGVVGMCVCEIPDEFQQLEDVVLRYFYGLSVLLEDSVLGFRVGVVFKRWMAPKGGKDCTREDRFGLFLLLVVKGLIGGVKRLFSDRRSTYLRLLLISVFLLICSYSEKYIAKV